MKKELSEQFQAIQQKAKEASLPVFNGIPTHTRAPVMWKGGWESFVDLAIQAKTNILYAEKTLFDSETVQGSIGDIISSLNPQLERRPGFGQIATQNWREAIYLADEPEDDTVERVWRSLTQWQKHQGKVVEVRCIWFKDSIVHEWSSGLEWWPQCRSIIYRTVREVRDERNRVKKEATTNLHEYAKQMAQHERFEDAKNEEKRIFMATQLFPEQSIEVARKIAELAVLHHWWAIEPAQALDKEQKARQLYQSGEPIANIAASLEISVAKVKKAVEGVERVLDKK